jgi:hypothetical protein
MTHDNGNASTTTYQYSLGGDLLSLANAFGAAGAAVAMALRGDEGWRLKAEG